MDALKRGNKHVDSYGMSCAHAQIDSAHKFKKSNFFQMSKIQHN